MKTIIIGLITLYAVISILGSSFLLIIFNKELVKKYELWGYLITGCLALILSIYLIYLK